MTPTEESPPHGLLQHCVPHQWSLGLMHLDWWLGELNLCWEDLGLSCSLFSSSTAPWFPGSAALCISWLHIKLQSPSPQTLWNGGVVPILLVPGFSSPTPFPSSLTLGSLAKLFCPHFTSMRALTGCCV